MLLLLLLSRFSRVLLCSTPEREAHQAPPSLGFSRPGSGRSPGKGNGNPLQYSCLENPWGGGAWLAAIYGVTQSWARLKQLSSSSSRPILT